MMIEAAGMFECAHRYVVTTTDGNLWFFVCEACKHRTEQLPVTLDTSFGQLLAFPARSAELRSASPGIAAVRGRVH
jgi:hypothetical protein